MRYLKAPRGRHLCLSCNKTSRLPHSLSYWTLLFVAACAGAIPLVVLFWDWGGYWPQVGAVIGGAIVAFPIDKCFLDGRYRKLRKMEIDE